MAYLSNDISPCDDYIQARDIESKYEELEAELECLQEALSDAEAELESAQENMADITEDNFDNDKIDADDTTEYERQKAKAEDALEDAQIDVKKAREELEEWTKDYMDDYTMWKQAYSELDNYGAISNQEQLIAESAFTDYIQQFVNDCGDVPDLPSYILLNIDWDGVASDLSVDYSQIEIDGNTFYFRSN
jgi:DNA repair exonuclease SbcCD ATPase subunit